MSRRTSNPLWNSTLVFDDVSHQELAERSLELCIWNHDRLASKEFLGGVRLNLGTGTILAFQSLTKTTNIHFCEKLATSFL